MSVCDMTYSTLGHILTWIVIVADNNEYNPPKQDVELENNSLLTLSSVYLGKSLETHERSHPEKSLRNQNLVKWDRHSVTFTNLVEVIITYTSMTPLMVQ